MLEMARNGSGVVAPLLAGYAVTAVRDLEDRVPDAESALARSTA